MKSIKEIVNPNRNTDSPIEEILYKEFLTYGIEPDVQYPVGVFFIDLAFPTIKLAIEADGRIYHTSPEQIEKDRYREEKIKKEGWKFKRFTGGNIYKNYKFIVAKILLQEMENKLDENGKKKAIGVVASVLARRDAKLAEHMVRCYLEGYVHE